MKCLSVRLPPTDDSSATVGSIIFLNGSDRLSLAAIPFLDRYAANDTSRGRCSPSSARPGSLAISWGFVSLGPYWILFFSAKNPELFHTHGLIIYPERNWPVRAHTEFAVAVLVAQSLCASIARYCLAVAADLAQ